MDTRLKVDGDGLVGPANLVHFLQRAGIPSAGVLAAGEWLHEKPDHVIYGFCSADEKWTFAEGPEDGRLDYVEVWPEFSTGSSTAS